MRKPRRKTRRHTPIPFLAQHISAFNAGRESKQHLAEVIASLADRFYAASTYRERRITVNSFETVDDERNNPDGRS